ncbi:MAG: thioether cross-link-forming SCIFF peptide maturase [Sporomusaceae bacterium]|jgi:uncharacterized protein|nr:thioether cross-link-forming SCIFF peptide maturase [Sporomusaceae bacterium]
MGIHKFFLHGLYILLDVNSGAIHSVDEMVYEIMDIFDGSNDQEVIAALGAKYAVEELAEGLAELKELQAAGALFSPEIEAPSNLNEEFLIKSLCLHLSHDCNLRCRYCFAGTGSFGQERSLMSYQTGEAAVEFLLKNSGARKQCEIDFFGGEPLLNLDGLKQIVSYIRKREKETGKVFALTLTTNAVLLQDEALKYLNDNEISLVLSLDGRQEVNDKMRPYPDGSGSYQSVLANIKRAVDSRQGKNYYLRGTFTAHNLDFAADVLSFAEMGFKELSVEPVVAKGAAYEITEEHLPLIYAEYEKLAQEYLAKKASGEGFEFFHFNLGIENAPCLVKRLSGCGAGYEYFAVTPTGDLYPCHQFVGRDGYKVGSVFDGLTEAGKNLAQEFKSANVLNKPRCADCWAKFYCSGGCHANAQLFSGNLLEPYEIGCQLQKKRLECAIMIQVKMALS